MPFIQMTLHSATLNLDVGINVILPQTSKGMEQWEPKAPYKVLYLLHGYSDDHTAWSRFTSIERYANEHDIAVVMPEVGHGFYTDMAHGLNYFSYISDELPKIAKSLFRISDKPEDTYIAGLSMGGYGALKIGLTYPERFAAIGTFSGPIDMAERVKHHPPERIPEMCDIFGGVDEIRGSANDPLFLASLNVEKIGKTPIYQWCGTEDPLLIFNHNFRDHALNLGINLTYKESTGNHSWGYWDMCVKDFLGWIKNN